ncbi:hypothetical protein [Aeromonas phage 14AhydR10PP]|nr:hypothetical protein [Aeromonas phage 14AhydR10PP]
MAVFIPVIATSIATGQKFAYKSMSEAARLGGFDRSCIFSCIHGQSESHGGFTFTTRAKLRPQKGPTAHHRIADCLNSGMTREEAAKHLNISTKTIRSRLPICRRLGLLNEGI